MLVSSFRPLGILVLAALFVAPPSSALGQELDAIPVPVAEVSAGYTFMREFVTADDPIDFPAGWYLSGAVNVNRWFGVVVESTRSYKSDTFTMPELTVTTSRHVQTYMAGGRFFRPFGRVVPFGQLLAGVGHLRRQWEEPAFQYSDGFNRFALQPGGGVTVYLTDRVGVRVSGDFRSLMEFDDGAYFTNEFRLLSGFTFQWGAR